MPDASCLMWGNDSNLTKEKYDQGEHPKESWIDQKVVETLPKTHPYFGWFGTGGMVQSTTLNHRVFCVTQLLATLNRNPSIKETVPQIIRSWIGSEM